MRTLGTLILLSAAAFAQTPTAVQNPAATVSVQPATTHTHTAETSKPSPNGAKASATAAPKAKAAVSVKTAKATNPAATVNAKSAPVQAGAKPASAASKAKVVAVTAKPATADLKVKVAPAQTSAKASTAGSKVVPVAKGAPIVGVLVKPAPGPVAKVAPQPHAVSVKSGASAKVAVAHVVTKPTNAQAVKVKGVARVKTASHAKVGVATVAGPKVAPSVQDAKTAESKPSGAQDFHTAGRRDPFLSPVVTMGTAGSGCSAGKRCLTIDQIALKGVVKSESGMIAVVTNAVDKAYFLRENDPVFNGYVVKITGDSIIFKETFRDRLGKSLTRDVTKSITRPVA